MIEKEQIFVMGGSGNLHGIKEAVTDGLPGHVKPKNRLWMRGRGVEKT